MGNLPCHPADGCGGGQNCIVCRRRAGAFVHEDMVLAAAGVPLRSSCSAEFSEAQRAALEAYSAEKGADAYCISAEDSYLARVAQVAAPLEKGDPQ